MHSILERSQWLYVSPRSLTSRLSSRTKIQGVSELPAPPAQIGTTVQNLLPAKDTSSKMQDYLHRL